jgi:hypothetical protein
MGLGVIVLVKVLALGTVEYRVVLQRKRQIPITILGVLQPTTILGVLQRKRQIPITILGVLQPTTILGVHQRKKLAGIVLHLIETTDVARNVSVWGSAASPGSRADQFRTLIADSQI